MASLTFDIGKVSVTGAMLCRAQKSIISFVVVGLPSGDPETDFCPMINGNAVTEIGSAIAPTVWKRPFGARQVIYACQSSVTFTVEIIRFKAPAMEANCFSSREFTTRCAPSFIASAVFESLDENAITSQPHLLRNWSAIWPSPPIPITPTRSVGLMSN